MGEQVAALAELPEPVFVFSPVRDSDGNVVELVYTFLNNAAARLYGQPVEAVLGRGQLELFPSARELGIWDTYLGVLESGSSASFEVPAFDENGVTGSFQLNASRLGDDLLVSASDTTGLRRAERALLDKNVELEHASRMKSDFLATMSHELRTPLNSVIGFSEALRDGILGELTASQEEYVGDIFASGQHLLALINDILDLSKVEAGMMTLDLESVDLSLLLANSMSIVREQAATRRIALTLELDEHLEGVTQLDPRKTNQVIYNLLSNAVKFTDDGGLVSLRARRVPRGSVGTLDGGWPMRNFALTENEFDEFFEICVADTGIGIAEADLGRLFQPFSQIDSGLARRFEGTGLGLVMVKEMTGLLGGTVAVASTKGEGTLFAAWIPLRLDEST